MVLTDRRMTEFLALPPDRRHTQLIDGQIVVTDPRRRHQRIALGLALFFDGPPDLAVEVLSPSTWRYDIGRKKDLYLAGGLSELWLVDTDADVVLLFCIDGEALELGPGDR